MMPIDVDDLVRRAQWRRQVEKQEKAYVSPDEMRALLGAGAELERCFLQDGGAVYYLDARFRGEWFVSASRDSSVWNEPHRPS